MEVAARIKELRAGQAAQSDPSPEPAGDPAVAPAAVPAPPEPSEPDLPAPDPEQHDDPDSAATTLADMLRSGGGLFT
jgi:hypothetical protein